MRNAVMITLLSAMMWGSLQGPLGQNEKAPLSQRVEQAASRKGTHRIGEMINTPQLQAKQMAGKPGQWGAATYRGLTVGKSKRADMRRVFGKPKWSGPPEGQRKGDPNSEVWYLYEGVGEFPGALTVITDKRTGVILEMYLAPKNLSKEEAIKHFGKDYVVTRYASEPCLGDIEAGYLYESPEGQDTRIEYRKRGIAIRINSHGKVDEINYVNKPIGAPSSRCAQSG